MDIIELQKTISTLMAGNRGLLAMDESMPTSNKRFAEAGIPQTEEYRRKYRQMIVTAPDLGAYISGAILFDETVYQATDNGELFIDVLKQAGIVPGIKVDEGTVDLAGFPDEKITEGLDGLRQRLAKYYGLGARFAKWRAVINIGKHTPTRGAIDANMHLLARYAALCQEAGLVPIVEPEVLMDGDHPIEQCYDTTAKALRLLFTQLSMQRVQIEGIILKPNMVISGLSCMEQADVSTVATQTVKCLLSCVPAIVPGVAFLSGGQSPEIATAHLNAMHQQYKGRLPWPLTFSFARAIQQPALEIWKGVDENVANAQQALVKRARLNTIARSGEYDGQMEE